jgi:catechol 2,3-dioxygenase-like lactoylglutathione lyase family enzyme
MVRLHHIAVCVRDLDKAANCYEEVCGLRGVEREDLDIGSAIYFTDGVINPALLNLKGQHGSGLKDAPSFGGAHHFGVQVDDLAATQLSRRQAASSFFDLGDERKEDSERNFKDTDGVICDISKHRAAMPATMRSPGHVPPRRRNGEKRWRKAPCPGQTCGHPLRSTPRPGFCRTPAPRPGTIIVGTDLRTPAR